MLSPALCVSINHLPHCSASFRSCIQPAVMCFSCATFFRSVYTDTCHSCSFIFGTLFFFFFFTNLKGTAQGIFYKVIVLGFHGGSMVKNLPANQPRGWEDPLEKKMATYSSILAWEILGTEKPGGHSPGGLKRLRHNLVTKQQPQPSLSLRKICRTFPGLRCLPCTPSRVHSFSLQSRIPLYQYTTILKSVY